MKLVLKNLDVAAPSAAPKIFNPLQALSSTNEFKAEAAVQNMLVGFCPKCGKNMEISKISNGDEVFWCEECRVASPLPNKSALK